MPKIVLPHDAQEQPQCAVGLNPNHWLFKDIVFAYSASRGRHDGAHKTGAVVGSIVFSTGPGGRATTPADASSYVEFPHHEDYNVLGPITVIAYIRAGGTTVQQALITKCETSGGANTPFGFFTENGGYLSFNRSNTGGGTPFVVWQSGATITAGNDYVVAVTQGGDISVAPRFYLNGVYDSSTPTSLYGGSGTGAPTGNTTTLKIGNRTDLASQSFHGFYGGITAKRLLSDGEILRIGGEIDTAVWDDQEIEIWAPSSLPPPSFNPAWARNANTIITGAVR